MANQPPTETAQASGAATPRPPRALALAGPTASGKTAAALAIVRHLAPRMPVEIISVDSALVYRGMDIGTAKPTAHELALAPHHLIDILDPLQNYSAAAFVADATRLIDAITARGALPLLVGGTMLYFKALLQGLDDMPRADAAVRAAIDAEARTAGVARDARATGAGGPAHRRTAGTRRQPAHPAGTGGVPRFGAAPVIVPQYQTCSKQ